MQDNSSDTFQQNEDDKQYYAGSNGASTGKDENRPTMTTDDGEEVDPTEVNEEAAAAHAASNPKTKLAGERRDVSSAPARANEATDRNDSGTGGIPAGGQRSGSSLQ